MMAGASVVAPAKSATGADSGPPPVDATGLAAHEQWKALLSRYSHVVFVANSDAARLDSLVEELPETALYVFFNKVYKVLDRPFAGNALLVARSGSAGANIVYRREVADVLRFFPTRQFLGIMNMRGNASERFSPAGDFGFDRVGHLDLAGHFNGFYPANRIPSSGFALAVWLSELSPDCKIILTGFSARRSDKWKLFHQHDWTFEQVVLRLFIRLGKFGCSEAPEENPYAAIQRRFPGVTSYDIAVSAAEVLSERLEGANHEIDGLMSVTKFNRAIHRFSRWLKPKTRKQKLAEKISREKGGE